MAELNAGRVESASRAEWLSVDHVLLMAAVVEELGLGSFEFRMQAAVAAYRGMSAMDRQRGAGSLLACYAHLAWQFDQVLEAAAAHPSDTVRGWAAFMVASDGRLSFGRRLQLARRFAKDRHETVRECASESIRDHLGDHLAPALRMLKAWATDPDERIRHCAIEILRPVGYSAHRIDAFRARPARALPLLEAVRTDPSEYVRRAVVDWLEDARLDHPDWVAALCARWLKESPTPETQWIVRQLSPAAVPAH